MERESTHVLLIEDDTDDAYLVQTHLLDSGRASAELMVASCLAHGIELACRQSPDAVLLDLNLPDSTGLATLEALRSAAERLPVVVLTGLDDQMVAAQALAHGAQDYLPKDRLDYDRLWRTIRHAIERNRLLLQAQEHAAWRMAQERDLRRLLGDLPVGSVVVGHDGIVRYANSSAATMCGENIDQLVGSTWGVPIDTEQPQKIHLRRGGNHAIPVEMAATAAVWEGEAVCLITLCDLSERLAAEAAATETRIAQRIQRALLPRHEPIVPGLDLAGISCPAQSVGGDCYEYFPMPNDRLGVVIADATGHGLAASLLTSQASAYIKAFAQDYVSPGELLSKTNRMVATAIPDTCFISMLVIDVDAAAGTLTYANAGHPPGLLCAADGRSDQRLESTDVPIGVNAHAAYPTSEPIRVRRGDVIVLVTDGVIEARTTDMKPFGYDRLRAVVERCRKEPATAIRDALLSAVSKHHGRAGTDDDLTIVIAKIE